MSRVPFINIPIILGRADRGEAVGAVKLLRTCVKSIARNTVNVMAIVTR